MEDDRVDPLQDPPRHPTAQSATPTANDPSSGTSALICGISSDSPPNSNNTENQRIQYTLEMDLVLMRQLRSHPNPFVRGSTAMGKVAQELAAQDPSRFSSLSKKGVRDRAMTLLDHHSKGDTWKKRQ